MSELESVQDAAEIVVRRVVEQLGDEKLNASRLIKSLADLTVDDVSEPDIGWDNAKYHATRLALELGNAKNDPDKDRRYINRIWKDMVEAFEVIEPSIENDARKAGMRKILKPKKTDPKTGRVEFYLAFEKVGQPETFPSNEINRIQPGIIEYQCVKKPKLTLSGRLFSRIVLHKPLAIIYDLLPAAILLFLGLWYQYISSLDLNDWWPLFTLVLWGCLIIAFLFRAFYQVSVRGIVMAPLWMVKTRQNEEIQLEIRDSRSKNGAGEMIPEIAAVTYESRCLVCDSKVKVDNGSGQYRGRLIGKCYRNPVEHIYSFDFVTLKGVPLRKDSYQGSLTGSI